MQMRGDEFQYLVLASGNLALDEVARDKVEAIEDITDLVVDGGRIGEGHVIVDRVQVERRASNLGRLFRLITRIYMRNLSDCKRVMNRVCIRRTRVRSVSFHGISRGDIIVETSTLRLRWRLILVDGRNLGAVNRRETTLLEGTLEVHQGGMVRRHHQLELRVLLLERIKGQHCQRVLKTAS